jgi:RimJ/RimL family protein N-acetyltransferase
MIKHKKLPIFILFTNFAESTFKKEKILAVPYANFYPNNKPSNCLYELLNEPSLLNSSNRDEYTYEEVKQYHQNSIKGTQWFQFNSTYCVEKCTLSWLIVSNTFNKNRIISTKLIGYAGVKEDDIFYIDNPLSNLYLGIIGDYQNKGIGTEFTKKFINWWTQIFSTAKLQWVSRFDNLGSQNLAVKSGFKYERKVHLECDYYIYTTQPSIIVEKA